MTDIATKMIAGMVNPGLSKWKQITATASLAVPVYAFIPVGGNATFTTIEAGTGGQDMSGDNSVATYYESMLYTGSYTNLELATGTILAYLGIQKP